MAPVTDLISCLTFWLNRISHHPADWPGGGFLAAWNRTLLVVTEVFIDPEHSGKNGNVLVFFKLFVK